MTTVLTPGLYRKPVEPVRPIGRLARGDVPVFLGYARRGPVGRGLRIRTLSHFEDIFGGPMGYLWHAIKGFFETGGEAAYVLRIADNTARAASASQQSAPFTWRAEAGFPWPMIDPRKLQGADGPAALPWVSVYEDYLRLHGRRSADPGTWGNALTYTIRRASLLRSEALPVLMNEGTASMVASLAGLQGSSVLELSQSAQHVLPDGSTQSVTLITHTVPASVDPARQLIHWDQPIQTMPNDAGLPIQFNPEQVIRLQSVEFDVEVLLNGKLEQSFAALSPHPDHSRAITRVLRDECRDLSLMPVHRQETAPDNWLPWADNINAKLLEKQDWSLQANWPIEGTFSLGGGTDGLTGLQTSDYFAALSEVSRLAEVALIAAPDLVLPDTSPPPSDPPTAVPVDCHVLTPPPQNHLRGVIKSVDDSGQDTAEGGVIVDAAGTGDLVRSDASGRFAITGLAAGLITLRLSKQGLTDLDYAAQSSPFASALPVTIFMTQVATPRVFGLDEVLSVQQAMANPSIVGPYKVAILDPTGAHDDLRGLQTWRARLGDLQRGGFFAPWLRLPSTSPMGEGGLLPCPPSGHICGAIAAAERAHGIHRAGANIALGYAEGVMLEFNDVENGMLNPIGINAIRTIAGRGTRPWGTRSLSADPEWQFLTARRLVDAIEKSMERALQWMVFEPNSLMTRHAVATTSRTFLAALWRDGILAGAKADHAYTVKCDLENNPDESRATGRLIVDIGVAPTTPLEFIFFRLGHEMDATKVTEKQP